MLPFVSIFGIAIPMYGITIMCGSALGVLFAVYSPRNSAFARQDIFFSACYAGIGAFLGAKLLYLAITLPQIFSGPNPPEFSLSLLFSLLRAGFVFYGGAFGGLFFLYLYTKKYHLPYVRTAEALIPSIPFIHAAGRIGCFFAGCCYGMPAASPWGVVFRAGSAAPTGISLLPVQLYESGLNLLLFAVLLFYANKRPATGKVLGCYLTGYACIRFALEFFRYDAVRGMLLGLSTSQWISLLLLPLGLFLLLRKQPAILSAQ